MVFVFPDSGSSELGSADSDFFKLVAFGAVEVRRLVR